MVFSLKNVTPNLNLRRKGREKDASTTSKTVDLIEHASA